MGYATCLPMHAERVSKEKDATRAAKPALTLRRPSPALLLFLPASMTLEAYGGLPLPPSLRCVGTSGDPIMRRWRQCKRLVFFDEMTAG